MAQTTFRAAAAAAILCFVTPQAALAAGFDLNDQNFDLLFRDGNIIEIGASYHLPLRKVESARATNPGTGLPVAGGLGGTFTTDIARPIGRIKFEPTRWADCQIAYQAPFGGGVSYDPTWVGRYHIIAANITAHDASVACKADIPAGAFTVSLIAGGRGEWLSSTATRAVALPIPGFPDGQSRAEANSFGMGYDLGAAISQDDFGFRFSAIYHSRIDHRLKGTQTLALPFAAPVSFPVAWDFTTPASLELSLQSGLARTLLGHIRVRYVDWSPLDTIVVVNSATGVPVGFDRLGFLDSWSVAAGLTKLVNDRLAVDFTVGYDPDVAGAATRGPTNTTTAFVFGALSGAYRLNDIFTVNGSLRAVHFLPATMNIASTNPGYLFPARYSGRTGGDSAVSASFSISAAF